MSTFDANDVTELEKVGIKRMAEIYVFNFIRSSDMQHECTTVTASAINEAKNKKRNGIKLRERDCKLKLVIV